MDIVTWVSVSGKDACPPALSAALRKFLSFELLHFFSQLRDSFEEIGYEAIIGDAKDRASGSLLIATITLESFIPAKC